MPVSSQPLFFVYSVHHLGNHTWLVIPGHLGFYLVSSLPFLHSRCSSIACSRPCLIFPTNTQAWCACKMDGVHFLLSLCRERVIFITHYHHRWTPSVHKVYSGDWSTKYQPWWFLQLMHEFTDCICIDQHTWSQPCKCLFSLHPNISHVNEPHTIHKWHCRFKPSSLKSKYSDCSTALDLHSTICLGQLLCCPGRVRKASI